MQLRLTGLLWSIIGDVSIISKSYPNSVQQYFSGASLVLSYGRKTLLARSVSWNWSFPDATRMLELFEEYMGLPHAGALGRVVWEFPEGEKWELWPMCSWFKCRGMYCWPWHVPGSRGKRCFYWLVFIQDLVQNYDTSSRMHCPKHMRILRSRSKKWWKREHRVQIRTAARGLSTGSVGESQEGQGQEWATL